SDCESARSAAHSWERGSETPEDFRRIKSAAAKPGSQRRAFASSRRPMTGGSRGSEMDSGRSIARAQWSEGRAITIGFPLTFFAAKSAESPENMRADILGCKRISTESGYDRKAQRTGNVGSA